MEGRASIPALALLGLSFTGCPDDEPPVNPIVGDWHAIEIDGEKWPKVYSDVDASERWDYGMRIEDDLGGDFFFYREIDFEDFADYRSEYGGELTVDDSAAPKYRITTIDLGGSYSSTDGYYGTSGDYYDTGDYYEPPGTGGPIHEGPPRPLAIPAEPDRAPGQSVLACTLDKDLLTCEREGAEPGDMLVTWIFARNQPDGA